MTTHNTTTTPGQETATDTAKRSANELAEQAKSAASSTVESATKTAKTQADAAKSSVADEMSGVASALRTAAEQMRNGSPQERTFGQIAEGLADASDSVRNKDLSTMVQDVTKFARSNPFVFLGGAALIGFAATRFAKASSTDNQAASTPSQPTPYAPVNGDYS